MESRILIVEDEAIVAEDLADNLESLGYRVVGIANSAKDALEQVAATQPDLVLMDIILSGDLDGVEIARHIRNQFRVPSVYLTAYVDEETLTRAKTTQPLGYLVKPVREQELRATLEMALYRLYSKESQQSPVEEYLNDMFGHRLHAALATITEMVDFYKYYESRWSVPERQGHLERIKASLRRLLQSVDYSLAISRAVKGELSLNPSIFNLTQFCNGLLNELQHKDNPELQRRGTVGDVCLDTTFLKIILSHLLSDARKFATKGSIVYLDISSSQEQAVFRVSSTGIGIPAEEQTRIFDPFYRGSNTANIPGIGLGLTAVKRCVDLHGGTIAVESREGNTSFTVMLPLQ